jgi:4-diphosphocytidyl-2C-methyl-D-erythritol kinase
LLIITADGQVSAGACYKEFDTQGKLYQSITDKAVKLLKQGNLEEFGCIIKNDLYPPAKQLLPQIENNINVLKEHGACVMTGSGSAVIGIYSSARKRNQVYNKLFDKYGDKLIKAKTI